MSRFATGPATLVLTTAAGTIELEVHDYELSVDSNGQEVRTITAARVVNAKITEPLKLEPWQRQFLEAFGGAAGHRRVVVTTPPRARLTPTLAQLVAAQGFIGIGKEPTREVSDLELAFSAEPVRAWRAWPITDFHRRDGTIEPRLAPVSNVVGLWPPRSRMEARCERTWQATPHEAPWPSCQCGAWAVRDRAAAERIARGRIGPVCIGEVNLWGRVLEFEHGYRAQYAYPAKLYVWRASNWLVARRARSATSTRYRPSEALTNRSYGGDIAPQLERLYGVETVTISDPRTVEIIEAAVVARAAGGTGARGSPARSSPCPC